VAHDCRRELDVRRRGTGEILRPGTNGRGCAAVVV
jgi:hypothetical protein